MLGPEHCSTNLRRSRCVGRYRREWRGGHIESKLFSKIEIGEFDEGEQRRAGEARTGAEEEAVIDL